MAILFLNGQLGSGKDTVAKIIQRLSLIKEVEGGNLSFHNVPPLNKLDKYNLDRKWVIKKFAYKLKLILSMLTGIPVKNFEDQDFKKNMVINLSTFHFADKNTVSKYYDSNDHKTVVELIKNKEHNIYITVRLLLQLFGTDIMRFWMPNVWTNSLFVDYNHDDNWIITDGRFKNEFDASIKKGAFTVRINRGEIILNDPSKHISETDLDDHFNNNKFDYVIGNNGSLEELEEQVKKMLEYFNLS